MIPHATWCSQRIHKNLKIDAKKIQMNKNKLKEWHTKNKQTNKTKQKEWHR